MSPEALALAEKSIEMELRGRMREFARAALDEHTAASMRGAGISSMLILASHSLARTELEACARSALATAQPAFTADDAEPSDELRAEVIGLMDRAIGELSSDADAVYAKHYSKMKGKWPTFEDPRRQALDLAMSDPDIDLLTRRRKRVPLSDALKAPRYKACREHRLKAGGLADVEPPDIVNTFKERVPAVEAFVKVMTGSEATLGECIEELRAQRRIDAGTDKILGGLWPFANSVPGLRHGSGMPSDLSVHDRQIFGPLVDGALILLLSIDSAN